MAKILNKTKENPKLLQNKLRDGRTSLYLEYYLGYNKIIDDAGELKIKHNRRKESLGLYLMSLPRTPEERQKNKDVLALALEIRAEKEKELRYSDLGKPNPLKLKINFWDYYEAYIQHYDKKDIRVIEGAYNRFKSFIAIHYPNFIQILKPEQLDKILVQKFVDYLQLHAIGEGSKTYYARFKKVVKSAVDRDIIRKNPCERIRCIVQDNIITKDVLSLDEYVKLANTPYQNQNIIRAFFVSLYAGYRFCDVKSLKYSDIDYVNKVIRVQQEKVKGKSSNAIVVTPLSESLLGFFGHPTNPNDKDELVFDLPSHTGCLKALKKWTSRAGIKKHITWHCARHSFGFSLLSGENKVDIKTVGVLMGHSGLKHTIRYTHTNDILKRNAIESLPHIKL